MDSKRSGVTDATAKQYRATLPRQSDLIRNLLDLLTGVDRNPELGIEMLVLDAEDAYWQVPLAAAEQQFYCTALHMPNGATRFLVFVRTAQGSRGAPLSWTAIFGLICRLVYSAVAAVPECQVRMQTYVDDPIIAILGRPATRRLAVAVAIAAWAALGINLAAPKGLSLIHI